MNISSENVNNVGAKERFSFYMAAFFRDMSYAIMAFLSYFYIDVMGLRGAALTIIMVLSRLWDGVNDPIIGIYFDKSVTDKGKAAPFFKKTAIPVAILIIFLFFSPTFSDDPSVNNRFRALYALITYIIFEGLHTLNGTAFMSLFNSITPNLEEKNKIISVSRVFSSAGTGVIGGGIPVMLSFFENNDVAAKTKIYFFAGVFVGVCFIIYNYLMYKNVRERVYLVPDKRPKTRDMVRSFMKNRLLFLMILSNSVAGIINPGNTALWFYTYNLGNAAYMTYIGFTAVPMLILSSFLVPYLTKRCEKHHIVISMSIFQVIVNAVYLIVGYGNIFLVFFFNMLNFLPVLMKNILYWNMISDSIDYVEYKTGDRNDGMVFAIEGFLGKCIGSVGVISTVIIVEIIEYVPNAPAQSEYTMKGLFYAPLIITIVSVALSALPYFFYRFTRAEHRRILSELKSRNLDKECL